MTLYSYVHAGREISLHFSNFSAASARILDVVGYLPITRFWVGQARITLGVIQLVVAGILKAMIYACALHTPSNTSTWRLRFLHEIDQGASHLVYSGVASLVRGVVEAVSSFYVIGQLLVGAGLVLYDHYKAIDITNALEKIPSTPANGQHPATTPLRTAAGRLLPPLSSPYLYLPLIAWSDKLTSLLSNPSLSRLHVNNLSAIAARVLDVLSYIPLPYIWGGKVRLILAIFQLTIAGLIHILSLTKKVQPNHPWTSIGSDMVNAGAVSAIRGVIEVFKQIHPLINLLVSGLLIRYDWFKSFDVATIMQDVDAQVPTTITDATQMPTFNTGVLRLPPVSWNRLHLPLMAWHTPKEELIATA